MKPVFFGVAAVAISLTVTAAIGCSPKRSDDDPELVFRDGSQLVASHGLAQVQQLGVRDVEVFEPHQRTMMTFRAVPLPRVLDATYGRSWRDREAIMFSCLDGYEPTIPVRRVLEHSAFLAVERADHGDFTITEILNGAKRTVELGPFYVIWDNLNDPQIRAEGDYGWPYQVTRIDLVTFRSRFGEMVPSPDASQETWDGFEAFVIHCSQCHAVNGHGGRVGPELNYPANPTEYLKPGWLRKWIDDPTSMRLRPQMPPLNPTLPNREDVIDAIMAYLETIASHKVDPGAQ